MAAQIATQGVAFLVAPLYAHALTPEQYGTISLANSVRSLLAMLMPMGATAGVAYWYNLHRKEPAQARHAVGAAGGLALATSTAWLVFALLAGAWLQERLLPNFTLAFWPYGALIACSAWLIGIETVPFRYFSVRERQDLNAYLGVGTAVMQIGFLFTFVVVFQGGAEGQVRGMFYYAVVNAVLYGWLLQRQSPVKVDRKLWVEMWRYGLPVVPHQLSGWGMNLADRIIIGYYGAAYAHDLGLYSFGYAVASLMLAITSALNTIWSAVYMEQARSNPRAQEVLGRAASWCILGLALVAAGLILGAPVLIAIIGSTRYADSERYVAPLVVAFLLRAAYMFPTMAMFHLKKTQWLFTITGTSVIVSVTLNFLLVPRFGVIVASWASLIGFAIQLGLGILWGYRLFPLHYLRGPLMLAVAVVLSACAGAALLSSDATGTATKALLWFVLTGAAAGVWYWHRRAPGPKLDSSPHR